MDEFWRGFFILTPVWLPALAFSWFWMPLVAAFTPSRDALTSFIVASMRDEPEEWEEGYSDRFRHKSGLVVHSWSLTTEIDAPQKVALGAFDQRRVYRAARRLKRRWQRKQNAAAKLAAIEKIVGPEVRRIH